MTLSIHNKNQVEKVVVVYNPRTRNGVNLNTIVRENSKKIPKPEIEETRENKPYILIEIEIPVVSTPRDSAVEKILQTLENTIDRHSPTLSYSYRTEGRGYDTKSKLKMKRFLLIMLHQKDSKQD